MISDNGKEINKRIRRSKRFAKFVIVMSIVTLIPLFAIIGQVFLNGILHLNLELFTELQPPPGLSGGGVLNAIVGSAMLLVLALLMAVPVSILAGIFISEYKTGDRTRFLVNFIYSSCNVLQSMPAIVIGVVAYTWVVAPMGGFSMFSGAVALALMMLPYITVNTVEILELIPTVVKEAGYALGGTFYKVVLKVVLPIAFPGILNGIFISLGRVVGEAAPLLFTAFGNPYLSVNLMEPVASLPVIIFQFSISPYENWKAVGWGASFILLFGIIMVNVVSKQISNRYTIH